MAAIPIWCCWEFKFRESRDFGKGSKIQLWTLGKNWRFHLCRAEIITSLLISNNVRSNKVRDNGSLGKEAISDRLWFFRVFLGVSLDIEEYALGVF